MTQQQPVKTLNCLSRDANEKKIYDCILRCLPEDTRELYRQGKIEIYPPKGNAE